MDERERIAAELHEQYRATARHLGWAMKPEVDVPYERLTEAAKELDRVFADWHLARVREARARAFEEIAATLCRYCAERVPLRTDDSGMKDAAHDSNGRPYCRAMAIHALASREREKSK